MPAKHGAEVNSDKHGMEIRLQTASGAVCRAGSTLIRMMHVGVRVSRKAAALGLTHIAL